MHFYLHFKIFKFIITVMDTVLLNKPLNKIGLILKTYREKIGLNQSLIAERAGISTSMLSQIERSVVSPSIETLMAVCTALGMDVVHLFRSISGQDAVRIYHRGERLKHDGSGIKYEQLAVSQEHAHPGEMFLIKIAPHEKVGMSEKGHEGVEMGYVLSGAATLLVNGKEYNLRRGDSVTLNSSHPHSLQNRGKVVFKAVWSVLPPHKDYLEIE